MPPPGDDDTGAGIYAHIVMNQAPSTTNAPLIRGVIVAGLILLTAGGLLAMNFAAPENTARWERTFTSVGNVRVSGDANIRVETWDRADTSVSLDAKWYGQRSGPKAVQDGDTLKVRACDGSFWHGFYWHAYCDAEFVIRVPKEISLTTHGDSGRATISGTYAALEARTDSGRIEATDVTAPRLQLRADSGSVAFTGSAPTAELRTDSGSIRVDAETTDLTTRADSGSITADIRSTPNRVKANADSGSITVRVPVTGYRITTSSDSGRQNIDQRLHSGTSERTIDLSTDSGSITLEGTEAP